MKLSDQQISAFDAIMSWYKSDSKRFVLAGYAGTGKTTLARAIANEIEGVIFGAFTGKAADVLRKKGCDPAGTLHSYLYQPMIKAKDLKADELEWHISEGHPIDYEDDDKARFTYFPREAWTMASLCIVDEYSMLDEKFVANIERDAKKVLFLGDPEQLSPIEGKCPLTPDFFLTEIHRQALESSILRYSQVVRENGYVPYGDHGDLLHLRQKETAPELFLNADQVIVGKNDTRTAFNKRFRKINNRLSDFPVIGDKIICRRNNHEAGLFNGLIGHAMNNCEPKLEWYHLDFKADGEMFDKIRVANVGMLGEEYIWMKHRGLEHFQYAYAITCHMTQGSEFDKTLVYKEPIGGVKDRRRWLYTAITRARSQCILVEPS